MNYNGTILELRLLDGTGGRLGPHAEEPDGGVAYAVLGHIALQKESQPLRLDGGHDVILACGRSGGCTLDGRKNIFFINPFFYIILPLVVSKVEPCFAATRKGYPRAKV